MDRHEAKAALQILLEAVDPTLALSWTLYFKDKVLKLERTKEVKQHIPIICTMSAENIKYGLSVGEWIRITTAIELQYERLYPCPQQSKQ